MKSHKFFLALTIFATFSIHSKNVLKAGDVAPLFSCLGDDCKIHKLSDYKGKKVILYFYPKDNTPWCTQEAKGFRDTFEIFKANNIEVIGISYDSAKKHKKFKAEHQLPFTLLSDPKSKIFERYGAKGILINSRMTYIIDKNGIILHIFPSVSPKTHAQDVLNYLGIKLVSPE